MLLPRQAWGLAYPADAPILNVYTEHVSDETQAAVDSMATATTTEELQVRSANR